MSGIDLAQKAGPLPLGGWLAIVGGVGGYYVYSSRQKAAATPVITADTSGIGVGPSDAAGWVSVAQSPAATTATALTTNDAWATAAITLLIADGYQPTVADAAIRNYINGVPNNAQQQAMVDIALKALGPPPQTLSPPVTDPTPNPVPSNPTPQTPIPTPVVNKPPVVVKPPVVAPKPPPAKVGLRYVTVTPWPTRNSTLSGIALSVYGNAARWPDIYNANRVGVRRPDGSTGWITTPGLIYAGRTVYVP